MVPRNRTGRFGRLPVVTRQSSLTGRHDTKAVFFCHKPKSLCCWTCHVFIHWSVRLLLPPKPAAQEAYGKKKRRSEAYVCTTAAPCHAAHLAKQRGRQPSGRHCYEFLELCRTSQYSRYHTALFINVYIYLSILQRTCENDGINSAYLQHTYVSCVQRNAAMSQTKTEECCL